MILLAYLELQGESKDIVEMRLRMAKKMLEPYLGKKMMKQGDYWLESTRVDRQVYLYGLIKGIQIGMLLEKHEDSRMMSLYDAIFSLGVEIGALAETVTILYKEPSNRMIDYRSLFPVALLKFMNTEETTIEEFIRDLRRN